MLLTFLEFPIAFFIFTPPMQSLFARITAYVLIQRVPSITFNLYLTLIERDPVLRGLDKTQGSD